MINIILVALGGAFGSVARYLVGVWTLRRFGPNFPWGTLTVNIVGCFAIGLLSEVIARRLNASPEMRLLLVTGFLGGFTTFSAFSLDVISLFERDRGGGKLCDRKRRRVAVCGLCRAGARAGNALKGRTDHR